MRPGSIFSKGLGNGLSLAQLGAGAPAAAAPTPIFTALDYDTGIVNLTSSLTVNGNTLDAEFRFEGASAGASTWTATAGAYNLSVTGGGTAPTTGRYTPATQSGEAAIRFAAGQYCEAADASYYDAGGASDDWVFEGVFRHVTPASDGYLINKTATGRGIGLYVTSSDVLKGIGLTTNAGTTLVNGCWYHFILFCNRNGDNRLYVNGTTVVATANPNVAETTSALFAVGTGGFIGEIALLSGWVGPSGTIGSTADQAAVAKDRFYLLTGVKGSSGAGTLLPSAVTRASSAYLDRVAVTSPFECRLFQVGAGWPRVCRRRNLAGDSYLSGYLSEPSRTNGMVRSEELGTGWTLTACTVADGNAAPNGDTSADSLIADGTTGNHRVARNVTTTVATWVLSVFAKAGAVNHVVLENGTIANATAWFNLATGAAGTVGAGVTAYGIESFGQGWYRCWIAYTGTAAANSQRFFGAQSDNDKNYTGDGATASIYLWGAQCELATSGTYPTSYIPCTNSTATRSADLLTYTAATSWADTGSVEFYTHTPVAAASTVAHNGILWQVSDGTDTVRIDGQGTVDGYLVADDSGATQASLNHATDLRDGGIHLVQADYAADGFALNVDSGTKATDTSGTLPTPAAAGTITIGANGANSQAAAIIGSIKHYDVVRL